MPQQGEGGLGRVPAAVRLPVAVAATGCVGAASSLVGAEVSFSLLYLGPIAFAAWYCRRREAILVAGFAGGVHLLVALLTRALHLPLGLHIWNFAMELGVFLTVALVVSTLRWRLEEEVARARIDPLCGVSNRRSFEEAAHVEVARARRVRGPLTVAYLDLDDFKKVNDRFGHKAGDEVLVAVSAALRAAVRATDLVARIGGDEFAVLFPEADAAVVLPILARLQQGLDALLGVRGWPVSFSIGAVTYSAPPATVDLMLSDADALMYEAKSAGKHRVVHRAV